MHQHTPLGNYSAFEAAVQIKSLQKFYITPIPSPRQSAFQSYQRSFEQDFPGRRNPASPDNCTVTRFIPD